MAGDDITQAPIFQGTSSDSDNDSENPESSWVVVQGALISFGAHFVVQVIFRAFRGPFDPNLLLLLLVAPYLLPLFARPWRKGGIVFAITAIAVLLISYVVSLIGPIK
jgi:hypothetical protein